MHRSDRKQEMPYHVLVMNDEHKDDDKYEAQCWYFTIPQGKMIPNFYPRSSQQRDPGQKSGVIIRMMTNTSLSVDTLSYHKGR